jgi:hypothetical protein
MAKSKEIEPIREERPLRKTTTREFFEFEDSEKGIKKVSKEQYLKKDIVVHYPWAYSGGDKYPNVKKFIYEGFNGKLPVGAQKVATYGYGFVKNLKLIGDYLGKELKIQIIRIIKEGDTTIDPKKKTATISEADLRKLFDVFDVKTKHQKQDLENLAQQQLQILYPKQIDDVQYKYVQNSIAEIIHTWGSSIDEFSDKDKGAVKGMFDKLSITSDFLTPESLLTTKEKLDAKYIEDVIKEYQKLMTITTDTAPTEKKWQEFLKKHNWIFSFVFSFPIMLFQEEAYVGGKTVSNKDGKLNDFLVKNGLTENVAFIEIKTPNTKLMKKGKAYRGSDVFAANDSLSGGISQVLNQRDNFQKHFATIKMTSKSAFETFNSKCVVLMGKIENLKDDELRSFELLRSNSKDVEILTFDELFMRLESLQKLIQGKIKPKAKVKAKAKKTVARKSTVKKKLKTKK